MLSQVFNSLFAKRRVTRVFVRGGVELTQLKKVKNNFLEIYDLEHLQTHVHFLSFFVENRAVTLNFACF